MALQEQLVVYALRPFLTVVADIDERLLRPTAEGLDHGLDKLTVAVVKPV
jgi:hypothetical protein